jgi:hypothetical protein
VTLTVTDTYGATAQATANVTVTAPLTIKAEPESGSVKAGSTATFTFDVTSVSNDLSFRCSGLPAHSICSFNQWAFTPQNGILTGTVGLTISTTASTTITATGAPGSRGAMPMYAAAMALPFAGFLGMRRKRWLRSITTIALFVLVLGLASCGSDSATITVPGTPVGSYAITVTGTNTEGSATTTINLTVK